MDLKEKGLKKQKFWNFWNVWQKLIEIPICFYFVTTAFRFALTGSLTDVGLSITINACCSREARSDPGAYNPAVTHLSPKAPVLQFGLLVGAFPSSHRLRCVYRPMLALLPTSKMWLLAQKQISGSHVFEKWGSRGKWFALGDAGKLWQGCKFELSSSELQLKVWIARCCILFSLTCCQLIHLCLNSSLLMWSVV